MYIQKKAMAITTGMENHDLDIGVINIFRSISFRWRSH